MFGFMYLVVKELVKTVIAYIDHNSHGHNHNAHTSQEVATCLIAVMDL